jgi:Zn-dependent protease/CBS domain-containing protein
MSLAQENKETGGKSPWSFRIATLAGIPVRIHFTFFLFLAWIAVTTRAAMWVGLILAVFLCVVLHEFGHALTARRYGVKTRDITLYPIGGVAMLEGRPTARAELWIALAGPAVNVVIALVLGAVLYFTQGPEALSLANMQTSFLPALLTANVWLVLFNMIPAFPMDGGRVLRAVLALRIDEARATQIAAMIGQGLAIVLGFVGLFTGALVLMVIAFFVFLGAAQEASQSVTRSFMEGRPMRDAMQVRFRTIPHGATLETAAEMLLAGSQHDFPVVNGEEIVGILTRNDIAQGLASDGPTAYVARHMRREFKTSDPHVPLERVIDMFSRDDATPVLVLENDQLVGMLTQENLSEFIMLEHARRQSPTRAYGITG